MESLAGRMAHARAYEDIKAMAAMHPRNPADAPLVTLDNNALVALRQDEPIAPLVRALLDFNGADLISINVTLSTAMEAQRPDKRLEWQEHIAWLESLGVARGNIFTSSRSVGFVTPDEPNTITFDPQLEIQLNQHIHVILFPDIPFLWFDYRDKEGQRRHLTHVQIQAMAELDALRWGGFYIPPTPQSPRQRPTPALDALCAADQVALRELSEGLHRKWFNVKNDALGFYNHLTLAWHTAHPEHAVFVTSDKNFRKQTKRKALRGLGYRGEILPPAEAVEFLCAVTGVPIIAHPQMTR